MHGTSRAEDPDLHHHACVFNIGVTPDGKTRTLCNEIYFIEKMTAGALYRAELAKLLEQKLGATVYRPTQTLGTREKKRDWFEVNGVPSEEIERRSTRSRELRDYARDKGLEGAQGKQMATLATRTAKKGTPMSELFAKWNREGAEHDFTQNSVPRNHVINRDHVKEKEEALATSLMNVTQTRSHFARRDLVREVAVEGQGRGLGADDATKEVNKALEHSPEVIRLGTVKYEPRFTTKEVLTLEDAFLSRIKAAKGKSTLKVEDASVLRAILETEEKTFAKTGRKVEFSAEQVAGVKRLTQGEDQVSILSGGFGTGKDLIARAAKRAFEIEGYHCVEAGKTLTVSRILRDLDLGLLDHAKHHLKQLGRAVTSSIRDDFRRTTLGSVVGAAAKYTPLGRVLPKPKKPYSLKPVTVDQKTVLILHRSEAVSVKQMDELTQKVLERGGKICLIGDPHAPPPLERVSTFSALCRTLGAAKLTKNFRTHSKADQKAIKAITHGSVSEALKSFADRGQLHVATSQMEALRQMVADWRQGGGARNPKDNLLVVPPDRRDDANRLAQAEMKKANKLGRKRIETDEGAIYVGDRIVLTKTARYLGIESRGETGKVIRIGKRQLTRDTFKGKNFRSLWSLLKYAEKVKRGDRKSYVTIETDSGRVVTVPLEYYGKENIRLAYAVTDREAKEKDSENVFLLTGASTSREKLSFLLSRSQIETRIYTDRLTAGDKLSTLTRNASRTEIREMVQDLVHKHNLPTPEIQR
jgi:hypothetical protein